MFHYMAQSAHSGKIMTNFHSEKAKFRPVHQADVSRAVAHQLSCSEAGQYGLYGDKEYSIKALLGLVEANLGKQASAQNPYLQNVLSLLDDFFVGNTHDGNMNAMLDHYGAHGCDSIHQLKSFWEAHGLAAQEPGVAEYFANKDAIDGASLAEPSSYRFVSTE